PAGAGAGEPWLVWSHPRVSPDGRQIAVLVHREGRWRLALLPAQGGEASELPLPGDAVAEPAWSPDGSRIWVAADGSGVWNLYDVPLAGGEARARTRVIGGAFSPAPSPDGKAVWFLDFTAQGIDIRRLEAESAPLTLALSSQRGERESGFPLSPPPAENPGVEG